MVEFNPHYCVRKSTKRFQVKPVFLVNENSHSEYLSRPIKLKTLVIRSLAKLFARNHQIFEQPAAIDIIESLPANLRSEIFNAIERRSVHKPSYPAENVLKAWQMFFSSDKLVLREFLGYHWSKMVFSHIVNQSKIYEDVRQLVLQSNEVNQVRLNRKVTIPNTYNTRISGASVFPVRAVRLQLEA